MYGASVFLGNLFLVIGIVSFDEQINTAAIVALEQLRHLSESGVYETLVIERVVDASVDLGTFFRKITIKCELSSNLLEENHMIEFIALQDPDTNEYRSVVMDSLPRFPEAIVESSLVDRIVQKRKQREKILKNLEDNFLDDHCQFLNSLEGSLRTDELQSTDSKVLLEVLGNKVTNKATQEQIQVILLSRLEKLENRN